MKQSQYVIPEKCFICGKTFDVWSGLIEREAKGDKNNSFFEYVCSDCRPNMSFESNVYEEEGEYQLVESLVDISLNEKLVLADEE